MVLATTRRGRLTALDGDDAFIALLIGAMTASGHVSPEEAARAHHIIWSMRRFRHRSGEAVGRRIDRVTSLVAVHGAEAVIRASAGKIPASLRAAAFAIAADLVLVDGRMERQEGRFLGQLAIELRLKPTVSQAVLEVMRIKNRA